MSRNSRPAREPLFPQYGWWKCKLPQAGAVLILSGIAVWAIAAVAGQPEPANASKMPSESQSLRKAQLDVAVTTPLIDRTRPSSPATRPKSDLVDPQLAPLPRTALLAEADAADADAHFIDQLPNSAVHRQHQSQRATLPAEVAVEPPAEAIITKATAEAYMGEPFGIAELRLTFAEEDRPKIRPDDALFVVGEGRRVFYPTFEVEYANAETHLVSSVVARFLLRGGEGLEISLAAAGNQVGDSVHVSPQGERHSAQLLRDAWWRQFTQQINHGPTSLREMTYYLADGLARRLKLPQPPYPRGDDSDASGIEKQFEKAIGLLLGFDSVVLSMQPDVDGRLHDRSELANSSLPPPLQLQSVQVPGIVPHERKVEQIAEHVPEECFYVRCRSVDNYLWLRSLLVNWGGDLGQAVTYKTEERYTRERIERQLAIDPYQAAQAGLDRYIRDLALIGCDTLFEDGAAVGIVIESSNRSKVEQIVAEQRSQARKQANDVEAQVVDLNGHKASLLTSPGNRVRSFLVVDGEFLLITNSRHIARRFSEVRKGRGSLAALPDFVYARSKMRANDADSIFLYLSDAFFRNLVSPSYRIEMQRRLYAKQDMHNLRVAYVAAEAEAAPADSVEELIAGRFLPANFTRRPDASYSRLSDGVVTDSLRGAPGTFLPVPDIEEHKATRSEVMSYASFSRSYRSQWRLMDPVSVAINRRTISDDRQKVALDICITPYAQQHYSQLRRHLVAGGQRAIAPHPDDLLRINSTVRSQGAYRSIYAGLRDKQVAFEFANGKVEPLDLKASTFGHARGYLAMYPGNPAALKDVGEIVGLSLDVEPDRASRPAPTRIGLVPAISEFIVHAMVQTSRGWAISNYVETRGGWLVVALGNDFQGSLLDSLEERAAASDHLASFEMRDITQAQVYPYVRAHTYLTRRNSSANNASFLNRIAQLLNLPPDGAMRVADYLQGAEPVCPLGGRYFTRETQHGPKFWASSAWRSDSLFDEHAVPDYYQFNFVQWLRGLSVDFDLDRTTLRARVDLTVQNSPNSEARTKQTIDRRSDHSEPQVERPQANRDAKSELANDMEDIYKAVEVTDAHTLGGPFATGDEVVVEYTLRNTSGHEMVIPINNSYSRPFYLLGVRQHWIERNGEEPTIPAIGPRIARRGPRYAAGGSIIPVQPIIQADQQLRFQQRLNTKSYPPGRYTYFIEYRKMHGDTIQMVEVDFELKEK